MSVLFKEALLQELLQIMNKWRKSYFMLISLFCYIICFNCVKMLDRVIASAPSFSKSTTLIAITCYFTTNMKAYLRKMRGNCQEFWKIVTKHVKWNKQFKYPVASKYNINFENIFSILMLRLRSLRSLWS